MNRWKRRQVLDCGDEVFEVAALDWEQAQAERGEAFGSAEAKAVNRCARHRTPRRCRARLRFTVPMRADFGVGLSMNRRARLSQRAVRLIFPH